MSVVPVSESSICHSHDEHEHDMSEETSPHCAPATAPVDGVVEVGKGHINPNEE